MKDQGRGGAIVQTGRCGHSKRSVRPPRLPIQRRRRAYTL
jgi:hypothetical protein